MRRRLGTLAASLVVTAAILAGCASTPTELSRETSAGMQTVVVSIAESAAAGDTAAALAQLDELQLRLDAAIADGSVSAERAVSIQTAIDRVRADLQPAPVVEPEPEVEPEPVPEPSVDTNDDDDDDSGNGNSGPGSNNGNGNSGNGKDKND